MGSYDVTADEEKNRLYLTFEGILDGEEADAVMAELEDATARLEPGYDTVNDISEFRPTTQEVAEMLEAGKQLQTERGNRATVRVTGESVVGKMQFERHGSDEQGYHVATAETVADAERLLDEFRRGER